MLHLWKHFTQVGKYGREALGGKPMGCRLEPSQANRGLSSKVVRSPHPDIQIPEKTVTQLIWERQGAWADRTALECGVSGSRYRYGELLERAETVGRGLEAELTPGAVLAFLLPNSPEYVAALLGASWAGLPVCPINPIYTPDEIGYQLKNSGAKSILTFPDKVPDLLKATRQLAVEGALPSDFQIFSIGGPDGRKPALPCGVRPLEDVVRGGRSRGLDVAGEELALVLHSSGTTGLPKGVCLSHRSVTASLLQLAYKQTTPFRETSGLHRDVIPVVLPIFHNFGLEIVLQGLYHGAKVVTLPSFDDITFLTTLGEQKATMLFANPPMVQFLGRREVKKEHLQHLRVLFVGAAPIGEEDMHHCAANAPKDMNFLQGYGLTEGVCCLTYSPYGTKNLKTVGIPVPNTEIKVVDTESGETNPEFKEGELCFKGPQMFMGYLNNPKATEEIRDADGWVHTGDVGYYDSEGYFYIVDRIKELIKVNGYQVAPAELEAVLRTHPGVEDVGVTAMPDERKGEVPVGFIKVKPKMNLKAQDLTSFLAQKVAPFKVINKYIFIDAIPRSPSGKILRRELRVLLKNKNL